MKIKSCPDCGAKAVALCDIHGDILYRYCERECGWWSGQLIRFWYSVRAWFKRNT